jgi:hypothetical protein
MSKIAQKSLTKRSRQRCSRRPEDAVVSSAPSATLSACGACEKEMTMNGIGPAGACLAHGVDSFTNKMDRVLAAVVVQILGSPDDHFEFAQVCSLIGPWPLLCRARASLVPWSTIQEVECHLVRNLLVQIITPMIKGNPLARLLGRRGGDFPVGRIRSPFPARINFSGRP